MQLLRSKVFLNSFLMPFSDLENSCYVNRYSRETEKNMPSLKLKYLKKYSMNRFQNFLQQIKLHLQHFISEKDFL